MKKTQEERVLDALRDVKGNWINGRYFLNTMMLSQYHRAIWNLQKKKALYGYEGDIEASTFTDDFGFKSYRLTVYITPQMARETADFIEDVIEKDLGQPIIGSAFTPKQIEKSRREANRLI